MSDFLKSLMAGATANPQAKKAGLADFLFRRGPSITMRSRLTGDLIQAIFIARQMGNLYGDTDLVDATGLIMELWVSEGGKGRLEGVDVHKAVYNTNVGAPANPASPDLDPALDG